MKYLIALLILMSAIPVCAQTDSASSDKNPYVVLSKLKQSLKSVFSNNELTAKNEDMYDEFMDLFVSKNVMVVGDIDAVYILDSHEYPYKTFTTPVEYYTNKMLSHFKSVNFEYFDTIASTRNGNSITYTVSRKITGEKYSQYIYSFPDTIDYNLTSENIRQGDSSHEAEKGKTYNFELTDNIDIILTLDFSGTGEYKITAISESPYPYQYRFKCTNDFDSDAVTNDVDDCDSIPGPASNHGCRPDKSRVRNIYPPKFEFSSSVGVQFSSGKLNLPELNKLGYTETDVLQSEKGSLSDPGLIAGFISCADITYFVGDTGTRRNSGISFGFTYTRIGAQYKVTDPIVYTFKENDGLNDYRRRVTIQKDSKEDLTYNILNIPLLYTHRWIISKDSLNGHPVNGGGVYKWSFRLGIGPSLLMFRNTSDYDVRVDFEGLYQIDSVTQDKITYYDYFDEGSTWNVFVTANSINHINTDPGAEAVFDSLNAKGYDFNINQNYHGKSNSLKRTGIAINLNFDACYKIMNNFALKLGVTALYAPFSSRSSDYIPINKTSDSYNSLYNSKAKTNYFSFGLNVGFVLSL